MIKVALISLGCAKNLVDSENILGLLDFDKFQIVNKVDEADVVLINTCGFIESSKRESIRVILENVSSGKKVVVTGCLAERYLDDLKKEIPEVFLYIPIRDYPRFNVLLEQAFNMPMPDLDGVRQSLRMLSTPKYTAYLKVGEGCSNRCAFCAIPLIRGSFKSRPYDEIIAEAKLLASKGVKEIIVLEQDTTRYGFDFHDGTDVVKLLKGLLAIKELDYIRLLYLYPDEISDELIDLIGSEDRLTPSFDIPIQHSEDNVLKAMYRRGNKQFLIDLFNKIKSRVKHPVLRTTLMVGFPGESEEDVDNMIKFIQDVKFDHVGCFIYSREEGTPAYNFPNQIDEEVKKARHKRVMEAVQSISYRKNKEHVGEIMKGIVIGKDGNDYLLRSYWNAPDDVDGKIFVKTNKILHEGDIIKVKITDAFVYDLLATQID